MVRKYFYLFSNYNSQKEKEEKVVKEAKAVRPEPVKGLLNLNQAEQACNFL